MVRMLLKANADASLLNKDGKTALQVAHETHNTPIVRLLQKAWLKSVLPGWLGGFISYET
jgi:hypothetical protein